MDITIDNRVREARKELRLSQQQLALQTGLSRQSIIAVEKKHIVPTVKTALLIASALSASLDHLFWIKPVDSNPGSPSEGQPKKIICKKINR